MLCLTLLLLVVVVLPAFAQNGEEENYNSAEQGEPGYDGDYVDYYYDQACNPR